MNSTEKINFFKERTIGERFSAAAKFTRQNWKIVSKNLVYVVIPLTLLMSFGLDKYMRSSISISSETDIFGTLISYGIMMLSNMALYIFISAMVGAIMQKYQAGELTKDTGWTELKGKVFSISKNLFLLFLIVFFVPVIIIMVFAFFISLAGIGAGSIAVVMGFLAVMLLLSLVMVALTPSLLLMTMPAIVENKSAWVSIKKGFRLGFKYWGSTFVTALLGGLLYSMFYTIFLMPYSIYLVISMAIDSSGPNPILLFVLTIIPSLVMAFTAPIFLIFVIYHYCSIIEKEEGVTLTTNIDSFDTM